jgi:hypothetical protein
MFAIEPSDVLEGHLRATGLMALCACIPVYLRTWLS